MALPNLSGSNIQDTFQRLIHTDGSQFYNGTGSAVDLATITELNASSSTLQSNIDAVTVTLPSGLYSSSLQTLGNITSSGIISSSLSIIASQYNIKFGSKTPKLFSEVQSAIQWGDQDITSFRIGKPGAVLYNDVTIESNVTGSGNISASGIGLFNGLDIDGNIDLPIGGAVRSVRLFLSGSDNVRIFAPGSLGLQVGANDAFNDIPLTVKSQIVSVDGNITSSGIISASGQILGSNLSGTNTGDQDLSSYAVLGTNVEFNELTAQKYIISSSVSYLTQSFSSGSTIFGDTIDDSHQFVGYISTTGKISASDTIVGSNLSGTNTGDQDLSSYSTTTQLNASSSTLNISIDSKLDKTETGSFALTTNLNTKLDKTETGSFALTSNVVANSATSSFLTSIPQGTYSSSLQTLGNVTSSGKISASGMIMGGPIIAREYIEFGTTSGNRIEPVNSNQYDLKIGNVGKINVYNSLVRTTTPLMVGLDSSDYLQANGNITASNNISASGTIIGSNISGTNTGDQDLSSYAPIANPSFTGNITASGNISASGRIQGNQIYMTDHVAVMKSGDQIAFGFENNTPIIIGKTANPTTIKGHVTASGNISASGTIVGSNLSGTNTGDQDLSSLSTITQLNASSSTLQTNINTKSPIHSPTFTGIITGSAISSSGYIKALSYTVKGTAGLGYITATNTMTLGASAQVDHVILGKGNNPNVNIFTHGHITASGNISSSGDIFANNLPTGVENNADVTDATNVQAAGALMDSEVTNLAQVKAFDSSDYATAAQGTKADTAQQPPSEGAFANGDKTKLDGIAAGATAYTNANAVSAVAAADDYLKNDASDTMVGSLTLEGSIFLVNGGNSTKTKLINQSTTGNKTIEMPDASGTLALTSDIPTGVENNADVTDATNVQAAGALMDSEVTNLAQVKAFSSADYATAAQGTKADTAQQPPSEGAFADGDKTKLDAIESTADVTDTANVTAAGALMDSELADLAAVKAINQGLTTTSDVQFSSINATKRKFDLPSSTTAGTLGDGDVIYVGEGSTVAGKIYYYGASTNQWGLTNSDDPGTATGMLAVALGSDPDVDGMLLRGTVTIAEDIVGTEALGSILYLDKATTGAATTAAPSATGDIIRVIGYALSTGNDNKIWFSPDNTWVEHA